MVCRDISSSKDVWISKVESFIGNHEVQNFSTFSDSKLDGIAVVCACFFGVTEGVDMWRGEDHTLRFRLSLTGGDLTGEAVFKLTDGVVRKLVPETCNNLISMVGATSLYPKEIDSYFGDPFLFKVKKHVLAQKVSPETYDVLDVCADSNLVNFFIEHYLSVCGDQCVVTAKNDFNLNSPCKESYRGDDFDDLDFSTFSGENDVDVVPAVEVLPFKKRKLIEIFDLGDDSSKIQKLEK